MAPDAEAYLCEQHAMSGAHMTVLFEPDNSQETTIKVIAATTVVERTTPIRTQARLEPSRRPTAWPAPQGTGAETRAL